MVNNMSEWAENRIVVQRCSSGGWMVTFVEHTGTASVLCSTLREVEAILAQEPWLVESDL